MQLCGSCIIIQYITFTSLSSGTVWVMPALDLVSLEQLSVEVTGAPTTAPWLVLLQLVTGLKQLQARGVEETQLNLTLVARGSEGEGYDPHPTLIIVPPSDSGQEYSNHVKSIVQGQI